MTEQQQRPEQVAGGGSGKVVGRVKQAVGSALGNEADKAAQKAAATDPEGKV
jgi:uncharacterized protein YjbJ (UPF0337 family)